MEKNTSKSEKKELGKLTKDEGEGSECCGENMILSESGIVYYCLKCDNWEYSSS